MPAGKEQGRKGIEIPGKKFEPPLQWAVKPEALARMELPETRIDGGRQITADYGPHDLSVSIHALPPEKTGLTKFWSRMQSMVGKEKSLETQQLKVNPPVDLLEFTRTKHAPLSAVHPHVVVENGTRVGIGVTVPTELVDQWSEEKKRYPMGPAFGSGVMELYKDQTSIGAVIRVNGEPTGEFILNVPGYIPARGETFTGFDAEDIAEGQEKQTAVITKKRKATQIKKDEEKHRTEETDLVFYIDGVQGEESNADFDTKQGLVQVVFVQYTTPDEQILGYEETEGSKAARQFGTRDTWNFDMYRDIPNATVQGDIRYENPKITKRKINGVSNVVPLAEVNIVLVGQGGPIKEEMDVAPAVS